MINRLNSLEKRLNLLNLRKEANLISRLSKIAIDAPHEESEVDPEIESIGLTQGEDGVITLSADSAAIVSENLDKAERLLFEVLEQLIVTTETSVGYSKLHKDTYDPRLISLINNLEEANERLFDAGMQASHLRDGTGD
jgi:hypothetical protein